MEKQKKIILALIVIIFTLPLLQFYTNIVVVKKLDGYFKEELKPEFNWNDWLNNSYQNQFDKYFNQKFGFRDDFVRIHNQLDYTLFKELHAIGVIVGKEEFLYEKNYIKSYLGEDYIGAKEINSKVNTIDSIYQVLRKNNTELLVIIAPGKGYFYPEYIPDELMSERGPTNYEGYIEALSKTKIPFIDFNDLFLKMKDTSSIVLYPKTGIHWSQGSIPLVLDSIGKKAESLMNIDLPEVQYTYNSPMNKADKQDADIEKSLNLFFPLEVPKMSYPDIFIKRNTNHNKIKIIGIADSFYWQFFGKGYTKKLFGEEEFWYYYRLIHGAEQKGLKVEDVNPRKELFEADLVILLATESNLYKFPYGFLSSLNPNKFDLAEKEEKIRSQMKYIKSSEKWMNAITEKARKRGIPVDSMLYLDAKYMIDKKN